MEHHHMNKVSDERWVDEIHPYSGLKGKRFPGNNLLHPKTDALERENESQSERWMYFEYLICDFLHY